MKSLDDLMIPQSPGKVAHKDSPYSSFELLTPKQHRLRHPIIENENPLALVEAYLIKDIERAKLDYHRCWGACPEDGTEVDSLKKVLRIVRESRKNPSKLMKRGKTEGWL
jgi:hypothetical protein